MMRNPVHTHSLKRRPRERRSIAMALWANAVLLGGVLLVLVSRGSGAGGWPSMVSPAMAQQMPAIGGGAGVFVVPAQLSPNTWGCYLLNIDAQTLVSYQFYPADKQLRLVAARGFRDDLQLRNFNTTPDPREVKNWLQKEKDDNRVKDQQKPTAEPEAPNPGP